MDTGQCFSFPQSFKRKLGQNYAKTNREEDERPNLKGQGSHFTVPSESPGFVFL